MSTVRYIENLDLTNLRKNNQNVRDIGRWLIVFFSGVRQLNRVFSLRHLTIERGKEHRTFDRKNKLLGWDHFFTFTFSRRHWNDKFHIAQWIILENRSGSINKSWRFRLPDFYNRHLFGLLPVSLRVLSHTMWQQFEATVQRQLFFLSDQRERENCKVMFNVKDAIEILQQVTAPNN